VSSKSGGGGGGKTAQPTKTPIGRDSPSQDGSKVSKKPVSATVHVVKSSPKETGNIAPKNSVTRKPGATTTTTGRAGSRPTTRASDIDKIIGAPDDKMNVTQYLINRMLSTTDHPQDLDHIDTDHHSIDQPIGEVFADADHYIRHAASILAASRPILPSDRELRRLRNKSGCDGGGRVGGGEDEGDTASEAGTYTIDDDDDPGAGEVLEARRNIDAVFGVCEEGGNPSIVRPDIDGVRSRSRARGKLHGDGAVGARRASVEVGEEVFEADGEFVDYTLQSKYVSDKDSYVRAVSSFRV